MRRRVPYWHEKLLKSGSRKGRQLAARTVGHAHRVLHRALERAVETEVFALNVAAVISPPMARGWSFHAYQLSGEASSFSCAQYPCPPPSPPLSRPPLP